MSRLWTIAWQSDGETLRAFEPDAGELGAAATALAAAYGQAHNSRMMGQAAGAFTPADVLEHFHRLRDAGGHPFLLERSGRLAGDADLRNVAGGGGEIALLIADPAAQGRGLGTRFARMLHAFAFQVLRLDRVYAAVIPQNTGSRRMFEKLGYTLDDSPEARRHADEPTDLTLSVGRERFEAAWPEDASAIRVMAREVPES